MQKIVKFMFKKNLSRRLNETISLFGWYQSLDECKYAYVDPLKESIHYLQITTPGEDNSRKLSA